MTHYFSIALMLLLSAGSIWAQRGYILTGTVNDSHGQPMAAVRITLLDSRAATLTDSTGNFELKAPRRCGRLLISKRGFQTQRVERICAGTLLQITLQSAPAADTEAEEAVAPTAVLPSPTQQHTRGQIATGTMAKSHDLVPPHNTEDYTAIEENRFHAVRNKPRSTFSVDVDAASYSNLRRFINLGQRPPRDAVRDEEMINYFRYADPKPDEGDPLSIHTELTTAPWQQEHYLLRIGLRGKQIPYKDLPASNLVFLLDVSGSMQSANKLPLLQSALKLLTDQLRPQDKVSIVLYAGNAGLALQPTAGDRKQAIKTAIDELRAGGSTAGAAGIQLAYQLAREHFVNGGNNRIILATDGDFNVGVSSDAELQRLVEKERESGVFLTVLGFGTGNYKDNKMQLLADKGNGNHAYIDNIDEARKVLVTEFGGTVFAIAKDVKIQVEFNPAKVAGYRLIGYENRLLQDEDFSDDRKDAGELGSGHTVTALYEIIPAGLDSDLLGEVEPLKYQTKPQVANSKDWLTVKLRYKEPDGEESRRLEHTVRKAPIDFAVASTDLRWSASVAGFGMLLRDSAFKGDIDYAQVIRMAEAAKGRDEEGYRAEFIRMVRTARTLFQTTTMADKD